MKDLRKLYTLKKLNFKAPWSELKPNKWNVLYYGFFNDDSHRTIPLQFDQCYTAGLNTFQNCHFYSVVL